MLRDFPTVIAEFFQKELLRCFHFVFGRDVISVLANSADEPECDSVFAFFRHNISFVEFVLYTF